MGKSAAGKTTMRSIIFASQYVKRAMNQALTIGIDKQQFDYLGNYRIDLYDCAGQDKNMLEYLDEDQR